MADPAQPMIDWINAAPPADLAVEVMVAFGPAGLPDANASHVDNARRLSDVADYLFRDYPRPTGFITFGRPVQPALLEAIQLLEHSELVYVRVIADSDRSWAATRLGLAALATGKPAVRQRIRDRTGA